jgi:hypothetical protein
MALPPILSAPVVLMIEPLTGTVAAWAPLTKRASVLPS